MSAKQYGTVVWFNEIKGFGFIQDDTTGEDIFVHFSAIQRDGFRTLDAGERVVYEKANSDGGPKVSTVSVIPSIR